MATASQLDERAEGIVALEPDRGAGAGGGERVRAKEGVGARESDVAREGLLERDDRKSAREQPHGDRRRSDGDPGNDSEPRSHRTKMRGAVPGRQTQVADQAELRALLVVLPGCSGRTSARIPGRALSRL